MAVKVYLGINHIEKTLINQSINYGNLNIGLMRIVVIMVMKIVKYFCLKVLSKNLLVEN